MSVLSDKLKSMSAAEKIKTWCAILCENDDADNREPLWWVPISRK